MDSKRRGVFAGFVALLSLYSLIAPAKADFTTSYCSSQNTADTDALYDQYQSNGWCTDTCNKQGTYAFAVILDFNCWCTNYIPEEQSDTGDCSDQCHGFPSERCGNTAKSLYSYVKLDGAPSGTKEISQPTSPSPTPAPPSSSEVETSRDPETVVQTVTAVPSVVTLTPSEKPSAAPTTFKTQPNPTTTSDEPTSSVDQQTSIRVVTESGQVVTHTIVTTPTSTPPPSAPVSQKSSNTGAIVGGVVGGVAGIAAVVGGIFFLLRRRRQQHRQNQEEEIQSGVQRNTSTMSKAGLLRTEKGPQYPPPIATSFPRRHSRTLDQESISPISGSDRRNSRHMQVDQRLNPSAIFTFDNTSTGSLGTMDDSRDYHRALNVRNPDQRTSFS